MRKVQNGSSVKSKIIGLNYFNNLGVWTLNRNNLYALLITATYYTPLKDSPLEQDPLHSPWQLYSDTNGEHW